MSWCEYVSRLLVLSKVSIAWDGPVPIACSASDQIELNSPTIRCSFSLNSLGSVLSNVLRCTLPDNSSSGNCPKCDTQPVRTSQGVNVLISCSMSDLRLASKGASRTESKNSSSCVNESQVTKSDCDSWVTAKYMRPTPRVKAWTGDSLYLVFSPFRERGWWSLQCLTMVDNDPAA